MRSPTAAQALAARMTEKELSQAIFDVARSQGWLAARFPSWRATGTTPGFPDMVLVRDDVCLFVEAKSGRGKLTAQQLAWLNAINNVKHIRALVVRPGHWLCGSIVEMLRASERGSSAGVYRRLAGDLTQDVWGPRPLA